MTFIKGCVHNNSVRRFLLGVFLFTLFLFLFPSNSFAIQRYRVLGVSTKSSDLQIPPTVEGPGLILPDSPLFFLDELKQKTRLLFAFTPEEKAKVYAQIAGERLAELRFMLAKNNKKGIDTALNGVSNNLSNSAKEVSAAELSGRNISSLAKEINDIIKQKRDSINVLERRANGSLQAKVKAAQQSLLEAKLEVEDNLSDADFENEFRDDLDIETERMVNEASESAEKLSFNLTEVQKEASNASSKSLIKLQGQAAEEAKKAVQEAQKAAQKFQEVWKNTKEIKTATSSSI